jgi:hypothetical protein
MRHKIERQVHWTPRVLGLLFAAFESVFAFDVFGEGYTCWQTVQAQRMRLISTAVVLGALAISWRWERVGGLLFLALGAW